MDRDVTRTAFEIRCATKFRDGKAFPDKRKDRCRPQRHHQSRVYQLQLLIKPPPVVFDLACRRSLVNPTFASVLELEVLDGIGDIDASPIETGFYKGSIKKFPCLTDKGVPLYVFLVARLLAHES